MRPAAAPAGRPSRSSDRAVTPRRLFLAATLVLVVAAGAGTPARLAQAGLPARLSDAEFWTLVTDLSEPDGFFRSDNLVSNEDTFQIIIPDLQRVVKPGGVYVGVGPDQNFTYIAALQLSGNGQFRSCS